MSVIHDNLPIGAPWRCVQRAGRGATQPALQVRRVDDATFLLRQGAAVTWEAPVLALLMGTRRALLLDTGAVSDPARCPVADTVDSLIDQWCSDQHLDALELVVAHTHGHNDHTAGDGQFAGRRDCTLVGKDVDQVRTFFRLDPWPAAVSPFDLGGRVLQVTGAPGHDRRAIVVVDPTRALMFSGDNAYPGRLYVDDLAAMRDTMTRLVGLAEQFRVEQVIGCHVEVDRAGGDLLPGARFHAHEQTLPLSVDDLRAIRETVATANERGVTRGRPMSVYAGHSAVPMARLALRGLLARARGRA